MVILKNYWLAAVYLLAAAASFFWHPALLLLIFVFPAAFIVKVNRYNILYSVFFVFCLNILLFIFYMAIANLVRLPLTDTLIAAVNLITALGFCAAQFKRKSLDFINPPAHAANMPYLAAVYIIFLIAFVARVVSIAKFPAPILHDPVADSIWTKALLDNHSIDYFYSPGLHIITAFFSEAMGLSIPHAINLVTNSFSALTVLSWGLVTLLVTRRGLLALFVSALIFIVPIPSDLYFTAGKNALIMAIAFMPLVFYGMYRFYEKQSVFNAGLLAISLCSLFLIHYPTFGYALLVILSLISITSVPFIRNRLGLKPFENTGRSWLAAAAVFIFLICWFVLQSKGLAETNSASAPISVSQSLSVSPGEAKQAVKATYHDFADFSRTFSGYYIPIMLAALVVFIGQKRNKFWCAAALFSFWVAAVPFLINLLELNKYDIIRSSGVLLFYQAFALITAYALYAALGHIRLRSVAGYVYALILLVFVSWFGASQFRNYHSKTLALEAVDSYDLAAYKWINDNHLHTKFLINAVKSPQRSVIFPTDGGMWIPAYTASDVSDNFTDLKQTRQNPTYQAYADIKNGQNIQGNLRFIAGEGYQYYYYDKGVFGPPLNPAIIKSNSRLVYSNPQVAIYKLF